MTKKTPASINPQLEDQLAALYRSRSPDPVFSDRLERRLIAPAQDLSRPASQSKPASRLVITLQRPAWAFALVVVLVLALTVTLVGPQRVLAAVQQLLGYVPGIGFVDLDRARVLAAPVTASQGDVTLQVDSVFAHPRGTVLLISTLGMPAEEKFTPGLDTDSPLAATLRLSDGLISQPRSAEYSYGWAKLEFAPIPADVDRFTLEIVRLPLVPPGAAPENWSVPLTLIPLEGELAAGSYPQPYAPSGATETANGVTLSVVGVAQSAQETGVQIQAQWEDPTWRWSSSMDVALQDDIGHTYPELSASHGSAGFVVVEPLEGGGEPAPSLPTDLGTHIFAPLSLAAQRVTLAVDRVFFAVPGDASFTFNPGPNPQVGQVWPLDERLQVAGLPVHVVGAQLTEDTSWRETGPFYSLEFILEVAAQADRSLNTLLLDSPGASGAGFSGGSGSRSVASVTFHRTLPEVVEINFREVELAIHGPWNITWDVTPPAGARYSVLELHPAQAAEDRNGLRLSVNEVLITDEITLAKIDISGLPERSAVVGLRGPAELGSDAWPSLEDQRGTKLEVLPGLGWVNPSEADLVQELTFSAPSPLARSLTLTIPGVEVLSPGTAKFMVEVPEGLIFHEELYETTVIGKDGTEQQATGTRWVSGWEVDISVELAGYGFHFTRAQVEREDNLGAGRFWLTLYGDVLGGEQGDERLIELRFANIARPDGETQQVDYSNPSWDIHLRPQGGVEQPGPANDGRRAFLRLNVSDGTGLALLPGQYTVELDGVVVSVPGPWRLKWDLDSP